MKTFVLGSSKSQVMGMIPEQTIHKIHLNQQKIALVRSGVTFYAFQADCPHRGASLIQGMLTDSKEIICPLHEYRFDLRTGKLKSGSCGDLEIFSTELTDEGLKIFLP